MAKKTKESTATLGFEAKLWHAADLMRGKLPATQYRQVLTGLLFLRYVSDAFENRYRELKAEGYGDEEDRDAYMEKNIFFVPKSARWAKIAAVAHEANNGETIDNAMIAIERENKRLIVESYEQSEEFYNLLLSNEEAKETVLKAIAKQVYETLRNGETAVEDNRPPLSATIIAPPACLSRTPESANA